MKTHAISAVLALCAALSANAGERTLTTVATYLDGRVERREYSTSQEGRVAIFRISAAEVGAGVKTLDVIPTFATARKGEEGYFVLPNGILGTFHETNGTCSTSADFDNGLPFYGMKTPRDTFCMIVKGMRYMYSTRVEVKGGLYQGFIRYFLDGDMPYEDFAFEFTFLPPEAEYPQMARVYRDWQLARGAVVPIRERMKKWPEVGVAATNLEIRIRQAWKPVPSPVRHQTAYNEPPVRAAVTFDRCCDIVREMKRQGIDHAEICLVGWNKGGHDGAYPQIFPVEPALGGEAKMREFIKLSNSAGFQTVCHTCFYSAYTIADDFDEEYLLKNRDGSPQTRNVTWGGGQPYRICPQRAYERYTLKNMQMMKDLGFHGLHYHDVYSILAPRICYDPRHPCTPTDSVKWYEKQMEVTREKVGGTQSEGGWDSYAGLLDFCMYPYSVSLDKGYLAKKPLADRHIPLFQLVYNGIILSNPFNGTVNYTRKPRHKQLKFIEFGGRAFFYWYANFMKADNWMGGDSEDLVCATDDQLRECVAAIKRGYDEFETLSDLQFEFMDDHRMLTPEVSLTAYSDGTRIVVNHGEMPYSFEGREIPAMDWVRIPPVQSRP